MVTQDFRPKLFKEVAGQKLAVETLKCIAKSPENAPKTIILQGEFGSGKTTCARILARALNCRHQEKGEPCGVCSTCTADLDLTPFYVEYDSAIVGKVDSIRELRETFYYNSDDGYRVIVLDEAHLMSNQAQAALLKVFEETKGRIFFVLCTTDIDDILPTIRSRSLELRFTLISDEEILINLKNICIIKGIEVPNEILDLIIRRAMGHARNAQMLLDQYFLLGDSFEESVKTSKVGFAKLFMLAYIRKQLNILEGQNIDNPEQLLEIQEKIKKNKDRYAEIIGELQTNSLVNLKVDYEDTVLDVLKVMVGVKVSEVPEVNMFADKLSRDFLNTYELLTKKSIVSSFTSDKQFQAAMWFIYISM